MKHNHNRDNALIPSLQLMPVHFEFTHPTAKSVCVAGCFNHWQPEAKAYCSSRVGNWWKQTRLAPGTSQYCLVVNGQWMSDPLAKESGANPFGWKNSILKVAGSPAAENPADVKKLPLNKKSKAKLKPGPTRTISTPE